MIQSERDRDISEREREEDKSKGERKNYNRAREGGKYKIPNRVRVGQN